MLQDVADAGRHHERSDGKFASKFPTAATSIWELQFRNLAEKRLFSLHTFILSLNSAQNNLYG